LRFLVDECIPIEITRELQARNLDVYDPRQKNTRGMNEKAILSLASNEQRMIVTRDLDFNLISAGNFKLNGIILLRFRLETKVSTLVRFFKNFLDSDYLIGCEGHIVVISPSGVRIRRIHFP